MAACWARIAARPRIAPASPPTGGPPLGGRLPGVIYVKAVEADQYLGKIVDDKYLPTREASQEQVAQMVLIAADPGEAAKVHGVKTGQCSCCGLPLTNAESIKLGIGPICRDKYGF